MIKIYLELEEFEKLEEAFLPEHRFVDTELYEQGQRNFAFPFVQLFKERTVFIEKRTKK